MLVKGPDDKRRDLDALNRLLARLRIDSGARRRIETELRRLEAGIRGEREAAYEIDFHYASSPNWMIIHDLRIEVGGRVAQIDHLLIDRLMGICVCESKHFSEGVAVDEMGEWAAFHRGRPYGIGSPIEQNRKHLAVLTDVFTEGLVALPKRLGITLRPQLRSLILVSKEARMSRPKTKAARERIDGLDSVIKVDQLKTTLDREFDAASVADMRRLIGKRELENLARQLVALHRPASTNWAARFGLADDVAARTLRPVTQAETAGGSACAACGRSVSRAVVEYSEAHAAVFRDRILCMDCQRKVRNGDL